MANTIPPFLYHGTHEVHLHSIFEKGLLPREQTGNSQWQHTAESRPDAVYLTTAYPLHFAANTERDGDLLIVEVDTSRLDHANLIADEDALALCLKDPATQHMSGVERARFYRACSHDYSAADSLARLGTCAHLGAIVRPALRRVARIKVEHVGRLIAQGFDPVISPANFRFFGEEYIDSVAWLFGDRAVCALNPGIARPPLEVLDIAS